MCRPRWRVPLLLLASAGCGDDPVDVDSQITIEILPSSLIMRSLDERVELAATVRRGGGMAPRIDVIWETSDSSVAAVYDAWQPPDSDRKLAVVHAKGNGSAVITASYTGVIGTADVMVRQEPAEVRIAPSILALLRAGETYRLEAGVFDQRRWPMVADVLWRSSDESIAVVDGTGLVTAVAPGRAEILATAATAVGNAVVTVGIASIQLSPVADTVRAVGDTLRLIPELLGHEGDPVPVDLGALTWTSNDEYVARVNSTGLVTAAAHGRTIITATLGTVSAGASLTVLQEAAELYGLTPAADTLTAFGSSLRLVADGVDANGFPLASAAFTWSSSDESVVHVDRTGLAIAAGNGESLVSAASGGLAVDAVVTVEQRAVGMEVRPDVHTLWALGDTVRLHAVGVDANGHPVEMAGATVNWSSSNGSVATVDGRGLVAATGEGSTRVTSSMVHGSPSRTAIATIGVDFVGQREALGAFYSATGGTDWSRNDNWLTGLPVSSWYGVTTDSSGRVTSLKLHRNGMAGHLPRELASMAALEHLDLAHNELTGPLPPELGSLRALKVLDLGWNQGLTGRIPETLGNLASLERLDLGVNELEGPVPQELGDIAPLRELALFNNQLTGTIPHELGRLTSLEELDVSGNGLAGRIPAELGRLGNLKELSLSHNALTGTIPPSLGDLPRLERLSLWANDLTGTIPSEFGELTSLQELSIGSNKLRGPIPLEMARLVNLKGLYLRGNQLSGQLPADLGHLADLVVMDLSGNALSGTIPGELGNLVNLRKLSLANNALTGPFPSGMGRLARLEELDVSTNELTGRLPPELGNLHSLEKLTISRNPLTGPLPQEFINLRLIRFNWYDTRLCSPANAAFQKWLLSLPLSWASLTERGDRRRTGILCVREALTAIFDATGGSNWKNAAGWLTEAPVSAWHGVKMDDEGRVISLDLPDNGLAGTIPGDVQALLDLRRLDLRENRLGGSVPAELGKLVGLEELYLSHNEFSGRPPPELGTLSSLGALYLSHNRFVGALPGFLARLQLSDFRWDASGLCAPVAEWFQAWLASEAGRQTGETCSSPPLLSLSAVHLTQATQNLDDGVPLIADRPALLRVFATADQANNNRPTTRAVFYLDGREAHRTEMELASARGIPENVDPGSLTRSYHASIPEDVMVPGVEMVVEMDPDRSGGYAAASRMRMPEAGRAPLDVREMPRMDLTIVPVLVPGDPDLSILEWTSGMGPGHPAINALTNLLPISDLSVSVRDEPYFISEPPGAFGNWLNLLNELELLRRMENGGGYYYGVVAASSAVRGIAFQSRPVSAGLAESYTLVHELGHNMSLGHTPPISGYDPDYPYPDHKIGVWGYDFRSGQLVHPSTQDVMSTGTDEDEFWISDYHFDKALRYRLETEATPPTAAEVRTHRRKLLIWGGRTPDGKLRLDPTFALDMPEKLPASQGTYRLEGFGSDGTREFFLDFAMDEIAHGGGGFLFAIPFEEEWLGTLERIELTGPEGRVELNRYSDQAMALVLDRETGELRTVLRGEDAMGAAAVVAAEAAGRAATGSGTQVLFSYGLPGREPS